MLTFTKIDHSAGNTSSDSWPASRARPAEPARALARPLVSRPAAGPLQDSSRASSNRPVAEAHIAAHSLIEQSEFALAVRDIVAAFAVLLFVGIGAAAVFASLFILLFVAL